MTTKRGEIERTQTRLCSHLLVPGADRRVPELDCARWVGRLRANFKPAATRPHKRAARAKHSTRRAR